MFYNNIAKSDFKYYKQRLREMENNIESFCLVKGFYIDRDRYYEESLAININTKGDSNFAGNISFQYLDRGGKVKFHFGLIKTCDIGKYRHSKKKTIVEECSIDFFEKNIFSLLEKAFQEYDSIKIEDLTLRIELPPRYND